MKHIQNFLLLTVIAISALLPAEAVAQFVKQDKPTINYTAEHPRYILGGLTVDGIKGFDDEYLLGLSGLTVGKTYEVPGVEMSEAIRRYWGQKLFSSVRIEADSIVGSKIYLHIYLTAQPRISNIKYEGVKKSEREDIEGILGLQKGNQITPDMVDRAKLVIKRYFEDKGYKNATVEILQREDVTAENKVLVDINIDKNEKIKINRIYVSGVDEKEAKKLKRAMKKTRDKAFINILKSKKFIQDKYEEDKGLLIDKMNEWGYRDALLLSDSIKVIDDSHIDIYLDVYKGQKYYLRNINWVGNTVYTTEFLEKVLKMKSGDVYDQTLLDKRLNADEDAIGKLYYNNGYVFYHLDPVEINVDGDSIDLEMRIEERRQATFNHIRISGNDRVYEHVIRRELRTKPGDLFSMESIERTVRELANMGQFDPEALQAGLSKAIVPDEESGTVDINYPLVTKGGDQVELSAGWGQTGIVGRVGLKFTNFSMYNLLHKSDNYRAFIPQGDGQTFSISGQTNGSYYQSYNISFLYPWFGGKRPNSFSANAFYALQTGLNNNFYNTAMMNNYYNNLYNYGYGNYNN
jgi:outer membrane protein insertion porin family